MPDSTVLHTYAICPQCGVSARMARHECQIEDILAHKDSHLAAALVRAEAAETALVRLWVDINYARYHGPTDLRSFLPVIKGALPDVENRAVALETKDAD